MYNYYEYRATRQYQQDWKKNDLFLLEIKKKIISNNKIDWNEFIFVGDLMRGFDEKDWNTKYDVDFTDLWFSLIGFIEGHNWLTEKQKETGPDIHLKI